jgi:hypothetical protein
VIRIIVVLIEIVNADDVHFRLTELAKRRWPTQFRDWSLDGRLDPYVWADINASSWEVFNASGHHLDELIIG